MTLYDRIICAVMAVTKRRNVSCVRSTYRQGRGRSLPRKDPLWVTSGNMRRKKPCPLYPQQRPQKQTWPNGHVRFTHKSGHVRCTMDVRYGPKADISWRL